MAHRFGEQVDHATRHPDDRRTHIDRINPGTNAADIPGAFDKKFDTAEAPEAQRVERIEPPPQPEPEVSDESV